MTMYDNNRGDSRAVLAYLARTKETGGLVTRRYPAPIGKWRGHPTPAVKPRLALTGERVSGHSRRDIASSGHGCARLRRSCRMRDPFSDGMARERLAARPAPDAVGAAMGLLMGKGYRHPDKAPTCVHRLNRNREALYGIGTRRPVAGAVCPPRARIAGIENV